MRHYLLQSQTATAQFTTRYNIMRINCFFQKLIKAQYIRNLSRYNGNLICLLLITKQITARYIRTNQINKYNGNLLLLGCRNCISTQQGGERFFSNRIFCRFYKIERKYCWYSHKCPAALSFFSYRGVTLHYFFRPRLCISSFAINK